MRIDILTLFPNMMTMFFEESILKRAQKKGPTARCSRNPWPTSCRLPRT